MARLTQAGLLSDFFSLRAQGIAGRALLKKRNWMIALCEIPPVHFYAATVAPKKLGFVSNLLNLMANFTISGRYSTYFGGVMLDEK